MFNFLNMFSSTNVRVRRRSVEKRKCVRTREGRLSGYIPRENEAECASVLSAELNSRMLFFSLGSQGCTGLIQISSETQRVRAALLMIDGHIVGAFFGRHSMERKIYGRNAYLEILSQLAHLETRVSVQSLSNQLALATLPIFEEELSPEGTASGSDAHELLGEIRGQKSFGVGFVDDAAGEVSEIFYFAEGKVFCRFYPVSGEATFMHAKSSREPKFGAKNSYMRIYASTVDFFTQDVESYYCLSDIEGELFTVTLDDKDERVMAAVLRHNFHPGGLVSVLSKNRLSHREEHAKIIRKGEQIAIRPVRVQHHSHFVDPCRDEA